MIKHFSSILLPLLFLATSIWSQSYININGTQKQVDTLVYKQIGPGTTYTYMNFPSYPINVHMMVIDLNDQYNSVETFQANNRVGSTERMTSAYTRLTSTGHTPIGSVNGNFWIVSGQGQPTELLGVPHSGSMHAGEMITDPNSWNRGHGAIGFAAIDENRKVWISDMGLEAKVTIDGVGQYAISEINRICKTNELVFFNGYMGSKPTCTGDTVTEVFIKPISGQSWNANKDVVCEVIRIIKNKGANAIGTGESVLSGNGTAKTFLEKLTVGQQIKVNMGIYTMSDYLRPALKEMVTGNALVMKDGVLTVRNTNEDYNSTIYPRTGIGTSADGKKLYLIVIDGKSGISVGASTSTMCGILKAAGASNATSMDGGGSAQMMLKGKIVNNAADGSERAVANGWMLFSTAPSDNQIAKIAFSDYKLRIPALASYKPSFLGYNQYGVLSAENLEGVTLSCDPALGKIIDGNFVASATPQSGKLIANYNGIIIEKEVAIEESKVAFRLDSVLIDKNKPYLVEVQANSSNLSFAIDPSFLTWELGDPNICQINKGALTGVSNGTTWAIGALGNFKDTIVVHVQIPASDPLPIDNDLSSWAVKGSSTISNMSLSSLTFPTNIKYTYLTGRLPYVQLYKEIPLYSIPDSMRIVLNTGTTGVSKAIITIRANNETTYTPIEFAGIEAGKDYVLDLPMSKILTDVTDRACYPVHFEGLKLMLNTTTQTDNKAYEIQIKEFSLKYGHLNVSISNPDLNSRWSVYPNPVTDGIAYVVVPVDIAQPVRAELYSLPGEKMLSRYLENNHNGIMQLSLKGIQPGIYLLNMITGDKKDVMKLILK